MAGRTASEREELTALFHATYDEVFRHCLGMTRERQAALDLADEAFVAIIEQWPKLRRQGVRRQTAWLKAVCRKKAVDRFRQRSAAQARVGAVWLEYYRVPRTPEQVVVRQKTLELIWQRMRSMPAQPYQVIWRCWGLGMSTSEVAGELGIAEVTVRSHRFHALKWLRERGVEDLFCLLKDTDIGDLTEDERREA